MRISPPAPPDREKALPSPNSPPRLRNPLAHPPRGSSSCFAQAQQLFSPCRKGRSAPSLQLLSALYTALVWAQGRSTDKEHDYPGASIERVLKLSVIFSTEDLFLLLFCNISCEVLAPVRFFEGTWKPVDSCTEGRE